MRKRISLSCKLGLIAILLALISTVVMSGGGASKTSSRQQMKPQVRNMTQAFEVVTLETVIDRTRERLRLTLRNGYSQKITAYTVGERKSSHTDTRQTEDFICCDTGILPGATYTIDLPPGNFNREIEIRGVVLEDGTGDGDPDIVSEIRDSRSGEKSQLKRVLPLLQQVLNSPDADTPAALDKLISQVAELPGFQENSVSTPVASGYNNVKEGTLNELKEIRRQHPHVNIRDSLVKTKESYLRRVAKL